MVRASLNAVLFCLLIMATWVTVAIVVHATPTDCGRACYDAGVTENPHITLIGGD